LEKQVLFYSNIIPLNSNEHTGLFVRYDTGYNFAANVNAVPLTTVEFTKAAAEYVIVFAGEEDSMTPYAVLGVNNNENVFLDEKGNFKTSYIPAFIRRYPFIFTTADEGKNFTLCIDKGSSALNSDGIGYRLFESDGNYSEHLKQIINFMTEYQRQYNRTREFCRKLQEFNLLMPFSAKLQAEQKEPQTLSGFYAVSRERLKSLSDIQLRQLVQSEELEFIYNHIQSIVNFERYIKN
jgi:SapC